MHQILPHCRNKDGGDGGSLSLSKDFFRFDFGRSTFPTLKEYLRTKIHFFWQLAQFFSLPRPTGTEKQGAIAWLFLMQDESGWLRKKKLLRMPPRNYDSQAQSKAIFSPPREKPETLMRPHLMNA